MHYQNAAKCRVCIETKAILKERTTVTLLGSFGTDHQSLLRIYYRVAMNGVTWCGQLQDLRAGQFPIVVVISRNRQSLVAIKYQTRHRAIARSFSRHKHIHVRTRYRRYCNLATRLALLTLCRSRFTSCFFFIRWYIHLSPGHTTSTTAFTSSRISNVVLRRQAASFDDCYDVRFRQR